MNDRYFGYESIACVAPTDGEAQDAPDAEAGGLPIRSPEMRQVSVREFQFGEGEIMPTTSKLSSKQSIKPQDHVEQINLLPVPSGSCKSEMQQEPLA